MRLNDSDYCYAWKPKLDTKLRGELTPNEKVKEVSPTQELLWEFLAPKMLKKVGDEPNDPQPLLKRHLRDPYDWLEDEEKGVDIV